MSTRTPAHSVHVHETTVRVRYAETDQMGLAHHTAYLVWFEVGRSSLMRAHGASYGDFERDGFFLPVVECFARFLAPARYDHLVKVRTWVDELKSRSLTFRYEVVDAETGHVLATGYTKHLCTDREGRTRRFPKAWRALLETEVPHEAP
ncbi:MAG: thioesterase family protein [Ardenticatenia bacterium]|nr:thioesterase family protein [Ardenticatenia bacterium]